MKKLTGIICVIAAAVLLFTGCSTNNGEEIDLSPMPIETDEERLSLESLRKSEMNPFIMPQYGTEEYDYYSSLLSWGDECIPGKLYLECMVNRNDKAILLLSDTVFKEETGIYSFQPWDRKKIYAVAVSEDGDSLMKVDQETGEETVLYHNQGESINHMVANVFTPHEFYFNSGSRIIQLNIYTNEVTVLTELEGEVSDLDITLNSVAWADSDGNYFWYYYETGEIEQITYDELYPFNELYMYDFREREDNTYDLYLVTWETEEEELILENITGILYASVSLIYAQVGNEYIISVDKRGGDIETVYYAMTEDMELVHVSTQTDEDSGKEYASELYVREGEDIVRIDLDTLEAKTLFSLENGLFKVVYGGHDFYDSRFVEYSLEVLSRNESEYDHDLDKFYICGDCNGDYCLWADADRNWFWYHPHSGENERVEVAMASGYAFITKRD